tara:strand:+ start:1025 stop:1765 length:741 start_codon:yes stop_codon:yes gene_type:complete
LSNKIIYKGPSLIDGEPIVVIAIVQSRNTKTGNMVQTYILNDNGKSPLENNKTGLDYSICGNCVHRGNATTDPNRKTAEKRTCYVNLAQGVLITWKNYQLGKYETAAGHAAIAELGRGRMVRIGTYGDGAAVPSYIWDSLLSEADGHTAYTHQTDVPGVHADPSRFMVSADDKEQAQKAWQNGARTFRVIGNVNEMMKGFEILCPASEEAGRRTTCKTCKLCAGASIKAKSIAIVAHGPNSNSLKH